MLQWLWGISVCMVVVGSLLPSSSPLIVDLGYLHINDKVMHFCAYLILAAMPVIVFENKRTGIMAGLWMIALGVLMEAGQHFSPGRDVELGDVIADCLGVFTGIVLGAPLRPR